MIAITTRSSMSVKRYPFIFIRSFLSYQLWWVFYHTIATTVNLIKLSVWISWLVVINSDPWGSRYRSAECSSLRM